MKKLLFAVMLLLTWYLAAMYRSDALMISAISELLIFLSMPVCVHHMKRNMAVSFGQSHIVENREEYVECSVLVENKGWLPISRFRISLSYTYEGESDRRDVSLSGNIDKKKKDRMQARILTPWNGKISVRMEECILYDYFSLFQAKPVCGGEIMVMVLPPEKKSAALTGVSAAAAEYVQSEMLQKGIYVEEFLQLREYTQGDSYRHIHWKQSARTDVLWVKEYRETETQRICVCLDFSLSDKKSIGEISAFYEILWSLLSGFLEKGLFTVLRWQDHEENEISRPIDDETAAAAAFAELYERNWSQEEPSICEMEEKDGMIFRFGLDLKLFFRGKELICFSAEHFDRELEEMEIAL